MAPDFLVIGAGVAGLRGAIELAQCGTVLVVAKHGLQESSSEYAQGGIAVALSDDDEVRLHEEDTLHAGDGLSSGAAVRVLVEEGPAAIEQLIEWGAEFDREAGMLAFTREAAHSRNRILHAHGDSTGREIARTLYQKAASFPNVGFRSFAATADLLLDRACGVCGAALYDASAGRTVHVRARAVLLATGGLGRVFLNTTNPDVATGDGVAMAWRAGAEISDIEFVQFHPTALFVEGAPRFLLSEALRGEGGKLLNTAGERFMSRYHPMAELAPRDVVARAVVNEMTRTGSSHVLLDLTHMGGGFLHSRFPRIYETCLRYGVNIGQIPVPVRPAAHYAMGGVRTDLDGATTLKRLFAAGEVAATGVHGANRLASNSLLEGVVFGARAGRAMRRWIAEAAPEGAAEEPPGFPAPSGGIDEFRKLAWAECGIVRSAEGLERAISYLEAHRHDATAGELTPQRSEARNVHQVALLIARCALARQESRGAHYRTDFPRKRAEFQAHSVIGRQAEVHFIPEDTLVAVR
ncbi:MAG: L-aspartate oxidase [Acidobacteriia bacterium]|nr:L-aspartate oxidase [Terriglobia bacterium]